MSNFPDHDCKPKPIDPATENCMLCGKKAFPNHLIEVSKLTELVNEDFADHVYSKTWGHLEEVTNQLNGSGQESYKLNKNYKKSLMYKDIFLRELLLRIDPEKYKYKEPTTITPKKKKKIIISKQCKWNEKCDKCRWSMCEHDCHQVKK